jgi:signal transduction histidine kinase
MRSLLVPLVAALVLSLGVVYGVQWSMVARSVDAMIVEYIADELASEIEELHGALVLLPGRRLSVALTHFDPPFLREGSGEYFQILLGSEPALRSLSLADARLEMEPVDPGASRTDLVTGPFDEELVLRSIGYVVDGQHLTIGVAADLQPIRHRFDGLLRRYSEITVVMLVALVFIQIAIVRVVLGSLRRVQADVASLERGEISQLRERVPREVLPLVREINRLIALLTERLQRSRQALGDLAHGLKTPLAVLKQLAGDEYARHDPDFAAQVIEQANRLHRRVDAELKRARVAGGRTSGKPIPVGTELRALVATLQKLHQDRALEIRCDCDDGAMFDGDREDLMELCGNLLDNACKWARGRVRITVRNALGLTIAVEDDGPGCPPAELERLGKRGVRLDESIEGHGLGLAIVQGIVASYGATIRFGRSQDLGGFAATVEFA